MIGDTRRGTSENNGMRAGSSLLLGRGVFRFDAMGSRKWTVVQVMVFLWSLARGTRREGWHSLQPRDRPGAPRKREGGHPRFQAAGHVPSLALIFFAVLCSLFLLLPLPSSSFLISRKLDRFLIQRFSRGTGHLCRWCDRIARANYGTKASLTGFCSFSALVGLDELDEMY